MWTQRQWCEDAMGRWGRDVGDGLAVKQCQTLPADHRNLGEARSRRSLRRNQSRPRLISEFWPGELWDEQFPCLSHQVCGTLLWPPQETHTACGPLPYFTEALAPKACAVCPSLPPGRAYSSKNRIVPVKIHGSLLFQSRLFIMWETVLNSRMILFEWKLWNLNNYQMAI